MSRKLESRLVNATLYGSVIALLTFFYLPILTLIAFSFRKGRYLTLPFDGVTIDWYAALIRDEDFIEAAVNSLTIAVLVTLVGTALGTGLALSVLRFRFALRRVVAALNIAPLLFPQLLLGIVLLLWFSVLGNWVGISLGLTTVVLGHVVYIAPFAAIVVGVRPAAPAASRTPGFLGLGRHHPRRSWRAARRAQWKAAQHLRDALASPQAAQALAGLRQPRPGQVDTTGSSARARDPAHRLAVPRRVRVGTTRGDRKADRAP